MRRLSIICAIAMLVSGTAAVAETVQAKEVTVIPTVTPGSPSEGNEDGGESKQFLSTGIAQVNDSNGIPNVKLNEGDLLEIDLNLKVIAALLDFGAGSKESVHLTVWGVTSQAPLVLGGSVSYWGPAGGGLLSDISLTKFGKETAAYRDYIPTDGKGGFSSIRLLLSNRGTESVTISSIAISLDADKVALAPLPPASLLLGGAISGLGIVARRRARG